MTIRNSRSDLTIFGTGELVGRREMSHGSGAHEIVPRFIIQGEPRYRGLWSSVKAVCTHLREPTPNQPVYLFTNLAGAPFRRVRPSFPASLFVHCALILFVIYVPRVIPAAAPRPLPSLGAQVIFYRVPSNQRSHMLPSVAPAGRGGHPGKGFVAELTPILGSSAPRLSPVIISKPLHPDNSRQTIIQASSPPDLRISTELKLPNVLFGNEAAPKVPLTFVPTPRRNEMNRQIAEESAPSEDNRDPQTSMVTLLEPANSQSRLPIPIGAIASPHKIGSSPSASAESSGAVGEGTELLIIGVDPAGTMTQLSLPPGNRWGEFSISPGGAAPGSPGGSAAGSQGAGTGGGVGSAGDQSVGLGAGSEGGGGGKSASPGSISISGSKGVDGSTGKLDPAFAPNMVYPVLPALNIRKNALVISVGARGGGGLDTYGALKCGKIYTIFLPMPQANWTMLYCHESASDASAVSNSQSPIIHLEPGIVPPDPDMDSRFDFKRLPVSIDKKRKMIVLKGTLQEDGSVADLKIFQSVLPAMDEAARDAFSRWKFKPAMLEGKPLAVQILVGIPAGPPSP